MSVRRLGRAVLLALLASMGMVSLSVSPALGFFAHPLLSQITQAAAGSPLAQPVGLTFDAGGNLFLTDSGRIDVFDPTNTFQGALGAGTLSQPYANSVAVDRATGDVYVADSQAGNVFVFKPTGGGAYTLLSTWSGTDSAKGSFGGACCYVSVAIDNSTSVSDPHAGDVYVLTTQPAINVFKPKPPGAQEAQEGEWLGELTTAGFSLPNGGVGATVDASTGALYVPDSGNEAVDEFSGNGTFMRAFKRPGVSFLPVAVGIEESTHNVYTVDAANNAVDEFDATGKQIGGIAGPLVRPLGVAVSSSGHVYVSDVGSEPHAVDVFGPATQVPDVTTGATGEVTRVSATLEGLVNPDGEEVASCKFEYGTSSAYGHTTACSPAPGSSSSPVPVSAKASGLTLQTTYHYRLIATNANGTNTGADGTFTTSPAVDSLQSEAATSVEKSAGTIVAKLNGSLAPDGADAHYYFEYGESESYGATSPAPPGVDTGEATKVEHAQTALSGLKPGTTYHFRLVGVNSFGMSLGADMTFTTPVAVDGLTTAAATELQSMSATLNGSLEPNGFDAHYWFEYGTSEVYGSSTAHRDAGEASETVQAASAIAGLEPNTTYQYRLVAENAFGTTRGSEAEFTTPATAPLIGSAQPAATTRTTATVGWMLNPENSSTSYQVLFGATSAYGEHSEVGSASGTAEVSVALGLTGLTPDTTYHYALQATNQAGTVTGPDETFTTAPGTPPAVVTGGSSSVALTSATVSGTVEPAGLETSYEIDFGVDASYGTSIYGQVGGGSEPVEVSAALQNLAPGTTYHYRVVAINSDGIVYGADATFTTPVYSNPIILPSTLPLIANPVIVFPSESATTIVKKTNKKHASKKRKHVGRRKAKGKGNARRKKKGGAHSKKK